MKSSPIEASHVKRATENSVDPETQKRIRAILRVLKKTYGHAECALIHSNAFELLVATILSAQCTDERVNMATPTLFQTFSTPQKLAKATQPQVESIIKSLGFFRSKAKNLIGMAQKLVEEHNSEVPQDLDALVQLPGVGRKTANVVLGTWFGIPTGVVVDTHVKRLSRLLGLAEANDPVAIERELMQCLPKKEWIMYSHRLIFHGRAICKARRPDCPSCPLLKYCPRCGLQPLSESDCG